MKLFDHSLPVILAALCLLVLAQGISGSLSLLSFEQKQLETVISSYEIVGENVTAKIERSLALGKPLENFVGMEALLADAREQGEVLDNVAVLDGNGQLLYTLEEDANIDNEGLPAGNKLSQASRNEHVQVGEMHYLLFPLKKSGDIIAGSLLFAFGDRTLADKRRSIAFKSSRLVLVCTLLAAVVLIIVSSSIRRKSGRLQRHTLMWLVISVIGGCQLVTSYYNVKLFRADYLALQEIKAGTTAALLQEDIEALLHKGLKINTLFNIEKQLDGVVAKVPEIAGLAISDTSGKILYKSSDLPDSSSRDLTLGLSGKEGEAGQLIVRLNRRVVAKAVQEITFDSITVMLLSMLVAVELLRFLLAVMQSREKETAAGTVDLMPGIGLVRAAGFVYIFGASLSLSFIPLHMAALYQPVTGFSREMVLGLPLALEMLGGGLVLIPAGAWIDRRGWYYPFIIGGLISLGGAAWSGLAASHFQFMGARLLAGVGYGLSWMSVQGYVLQNTAPYQRARGISSVVAGIFAGIICGNGMGALIADRIGFGPVFLIGGAVMVLVMLLTVLSLRSTFTKPDVVAKQSGSLHSFFRLLTDPQGLLLFACSLVPYSIVMVGLLYYITPLFLNEAGISQSDIGRVIMLFGLSMIFIAPQVSKVADRLPNKKPLVAAGGVIGGGCLLLFYFSGSPWIVVLAVFLFGFSVSISGASRNVMTLNLQVARDIGSSQVMGIYRSVDKLGQMLGAIVPATLMTWLSVPDTMLVMGGVYLLVTVVLVLGLRRQVV